MDLNSQYRALHRELRNFLDRDDVVEQIPTHLLADLDQIVTENELETSWMEENKICGDYPAPCNCDDPVTHSGH